MKTWADALPARAAGAAVLIAALLPGCGGCFREPEDTAARLAAANGAYGQLAAADATYTPPGLAHMQTPATPRPRPAPLPPPEPAPEPAPAPVSEPEEERPPAPPATPADEAGDSEPYLLPAERLREIDVGMAYGDVAALLERPGVAVSGDPESGRILRWTDERGATFIARFEDGVLVRKSTLQRLPPEEAPDGQGRLTRGDYEAITEGMTVAQVMARLRVPGQLVTPDDGAIEIYRWQDSLGSHFTARFDQGALSRKTGLYIAPLPEAARAPIREVYDDVDEAEDDPDAPPRPIRIDDDETEPAETPAETERRIEEDPETRERPAPLEARETRPAEDPPAGERVAQEAPPEPSRVRIAGETRRQRDGVEEAVPARPGHARRASLPDYTWSLRRGAYEIRIENPSRTRVQVGLRSGRYGRDLALGPGQSRSVYVDRGSYTIHFIYADDPFTLYGGHGIRLDGDRLGDVRVTLINEGLDVRRLPAVDPFSAFDRQW